MYAICRRGVVWLQALDLLLPVSSQQTLAEVIEGSDRLVFVGSVETFDHAVVVCTRKEGDGQALLSQLRFRNNNTVFLRENRGQSDPFVVFLFALLVTVAYGT